MSTTSEKLEKAAWNVDDYHQLYHTGQNILQDLNTVLSHLEAGLSCDAVIGDVPGTNLPLALTKLRSILQSYLKDLFKKKRKPATDILVFLISESTRAKNDLCNSSTVHSSCWSTRPRSPSYCKWNQARNDKDWNESRRQEIEFYIGSK